MLACRRSQPLQAFLQATVALQSTLKLEETQSQKLQYLSCHAHHPTAKQPAPAAWPSAHREPSLQIWLHCSLLQVAKHPQSSSIAWRSLPKRLMKSHQMPGARCVRSPCQLLTSRCISGAAIESRPFCLPGFKYTEVWLVASKGEVSNTTSRYLSHFHHVQLYGVPCPASWTRPGRLHDVPLRPAVKQTPAAMIE